MLALNADALQILHERLHDPLEDLVVQQDLELHLLAGLDVRHLAVFDFPSGGLQDVDRLAQVDAVVAAAVGGRRLVFGREDFIRNPAAVLFENLQFLLAGQPARSELGVCEVTLRPRVLAIEDRLVGPLEVKGIGERLAHALILEDIATRVEDECLHTRRIVVGQFRFLHAPVLQRGYVIRRGPILGAVLLAKVVLAGLEGFQRDCRIAVVVVSNRIPIGLSQIDRQIWRPNSRKHASR